MKFVGRIAAMAAFAVVGATAASAQSQWSGFYAGINGGYASTMADHLAGVNSSTGQNDLTLTGGLFGGQIGYNWTSASQFVFGIEGTFNAGNVTGSCTSPDCHPSQAPSTSHTLNSLATLSARIGFANGALLPYVSAGVAMGSATRFTAYQSQSYNNTHTGWAVGAGLEWKAKPNMSVNLGYQYVDLGTERYEFSAGYQPIVHLTASVIRLGLNWHLQ